MKNLKLMHLLKEATKGVPINNGKGIDEVQERQRRRKMMVLREGCKQALWFADTFHIDLLKVVFQTRATGEHIDLLYNNIEIAPANRSSDETSKSRNLFQLEQILYLLDRFAISDQCYHELSMVDPSLPRSYVIKEARARINSSIILKRLPAPYSGCYRDLHDCIAEAIQAEVHYVQY